jgi:hypothetical protein
MGNTNIMGNNTGRMGAVPYFIYRIMTPEEKSRMKYIVLNSIDQFNKLYNTELPPEDVLISIVSDNSSYITFIQNKYCLQIPVGFANDYNTILSIYNFWMKNSRIVAFKCIVCLQGITSSFHCPYCTADLCEKCSTTMQEMELLKSRKIGYTCPQCKRFGDTVLFVRYKYLQPVKMLNDD